MTDALVLRQIEKFSRRFGESYLNLACHAAMPVVLNSEFVHLLRINFFLDSNSPLPYIAEADLLLSNLCQAIDNDLYELSPEVRSHLLIKLINEFGRIRVREVAMLLWQYTQRSTTWYERFGLIEAQQLTALNFLAPAKVAQWFQQAKVKSSSNSLIDRQWLIAMQKEIERNNVLFENERFELESDFDHDIQSDYASSGSADYTDIQLYPGPDGKVMLPVYSPDGFINREREIGIILACVDALLDRRSVEKRTFIFTGQHGIGKSWFLRHLYHLNQSQRAIKAAYINLEIHTTKLRSISTAEPTYVINESLVDGVVVEICAALGRILFPQTVIPHGGPDAAASFLVNEVRRTISRNEVLLLLLDTVYEAPPALLAMLEDHLLGLLAIEPNVVMVLTGRGREYAWTTPELRLHAEFDQLDLFTEQATAQLLHHHVPANFSRSSEIHTISRGNPKTTLLLASNDDPLTALDQVITEMLPAIEVTAQQMLREYLEALVVVRRFDYGHLPYLWSAYYQNSELQALPRREFRLILDQLLEHGLVYWNTKQFAYTLHEAMRNLLLEYMARAKPTLLRELHVCCTRFYQEWVDAKPRNWEHWQAELSYHQYELEKLS